MIRVLRVPAARWVSGQTGLGLLGFERTVRQLSVGGRVEVENRFADLSIPLERGIGTSVQAGHVDVTRLATCKLGIEVRYGDLQAVGPDAVLLDTRPSETIFS